MCTVYVSFLKYRYIIGCKGPGIFLKEEDHPKAKKKKSLYSYKNVLNEDQVWRMLLVLFYMLEHTTMESWMLRGFRFDKYFIVKTHQSLVRYSPFMFVSSWHNFNSLHRVLPTLLMLICEFATTVCAILYCNVCFWSIEYLTNVMCNSHRKLAPRLLKRRCVVQHGTRHHDDVCVVFFNEFFFF